MQVAHIKLQYRLNYGRGSSHLELTTVRR